MARTPIYAEMRPKGPGGISPSDEFIWVRASTHAVPYLDITRRTDLTCGRIYDSDIMLVACGVQGMSWVNLAPVPAYQIALSTRSQHPPPSLPPPSPATQSETAASGLLSALATALDPTRMDATVLAYRRQGFFVWEKLNGTHECTPGNNSARCVCRTSFIASPRALHL